MSIKTKKLILYISFIPYIYLIITSLYCAIFGYTYENIKVTVYGIDAFLENIINDFWFNNVIMFNFIGFLFICCLIYQIWYFTNMKGKNEINKDNLNKKKINIKKGLYIISLLCWITYFLSGIYAMFFGYQAGFFVTKTIYGFEAFKAAMFWNLLGFTFIPVLPIALIYIIIYTVIKSKQRKNNSKI